MLNIVSVLYPTADGHKEVWTWVFESDSYVEEGEGRGYSCEFRRQMLCSEA